MIRPPAWWDHDGWAARVLGPLGALTRAATARRVAQPGWQAGVKVICCGNATMGGAGKTTLVLDLAARLRRAGRRVHILTRGYGGRLRGPLRVDPARHGAADVGDEALLLADAAPCWLGADRAASARAAIADGADMLLMDDGLQNPTLAGRRNLLVIDGGSGFGNARLFPAGPLREPPAEAAARCSAAVLIGEDTRNALRHLPPGLPVLRARLVPSGADAIAGRRVFAIAGIARPEKFRASLAQAGAVIAGARWFADHHRFTERDLDAVLREAARLGARPVTTAKDAMRLPAARRGEFLVLGIRLAWDDPAEIEAWLGR